MSRDESFIEHGLREISSRLHMANILASFDRRFSTFNFSFRLVQIGYGVESLCRDDRMLGLCPLMDAAVGRSELPRNTSSTFFASTLVVETHDPERSLAMNVFRKVHKKVKLVGITTRPMDRTRAGASLSRQRTTLRERFEADYSESSGLVDFMNRAAKALWPWLRHYRSSHVVFDGMHSELIAALYMITRYRCLIALREKLTKSKFLNLLILHICFRAYQHREGICEWSFIRDFLE